MRLGPGAIREKLQLPSKHPMRMPLAGHGGLWATMAEARLLSSIRQLGEWIAAVAGFLGPWGVGLIALADSAFIPMPQGVDALLVAQAIATPDSAYQAAGLGVLGSVVGSTILYYVGRGLGHATLVRRVSAVGVGRLQVLVGRWGAALLLPVAGIPLPMPMKPVVMAAGIFQMPLVRFWAALVLARGLRYFGMVLLAMRYGERALQYAMDHVAIAVAALALFCFLYVAVHRFSSRWLNQPS